MKRWIALLLCGAMALALWGLSLIHISCYFMGPGAGAGWGALLLTLAVFAVAMGGMCGPVSYTHLDVYKRQAKFWATAPSSASPSLGRISRPC